MRYRRCTSDISVQNRLIAYYWSIKQKRRDCEDIVNRRFSWPFTRTIIVPSFPPWLEQWTFSIFSISFALNWRALAHPFKGTSVAVMEIRQCSLHISSRTWLALNGNNTNGRSHFRVSLFSIRPFQLTCLHRLGSFSFVFIIVNTLSFKNLEKI